MPRCTVENIPNARCTVENIPNAPLHRGEYPECPLHRGEHPECPLHRGRAALQGRVSRFQPPRASAPVVVVCPRDSTFSAAAKPLKFGAITPSPFIPSADPRPCDAHHNAL
jgi:hypothetical protein